MVIEGDSKMTMEVTKGTMHAGWKMEGTLVNINSLLTRFEAFTYNILLKTVHHYNGFYTSVLCHEVNFQPILAVRSPMSGCGQPLLDGLKLCPQSKLIDSWSRAGLQQQPNF